MKMLNNPVGVFLYLTLRNDWSWKILSREDRERVTRANLLHNTEREDYAQPEKYGAERVFGAENWDSQLSRTRELRGKRLFEILTNKKPHSVLEIGPGAGFYTRMICEEESVKVYTSVDIGGAFLSFLKPRLEKIKASRDFEFNLYQGMVETLPTQKKFDLIVLLSTVHHIPERTKLFQILEQHLAEGGLIYCFDPSHYLTRIVDLIYKCFTQGYIFKSYYSEPKNFSTHHFCTQGEFKSVVRKIPSLRVVRFNFVMDSFFYRFPLLKKINIGLFSREIGIEIQKANGKPQS